MDIRSLMPGEESAWVALDTPAHEHDEKLRQLTAYRLANPDLRKESYLVATLDGKIIAKLRTVVDNLTLYGLSHLAVASGHDFATIGRELIAYIKHAGSGFAGYLYGRQSRIMTRSALDGCNERTLHGASCRLGDNG